MTRRVAACVALVAVIGAGLVTHLVLPDSPLSDIAGDALYAAAVYLAVAIVVSRWRPWLVALVAGGWCVAVELFQLTGLPIRWADAFDPVVLVFGTVFDARDLLVYVITVALCALVDSAVSGGATRRQSS